MEQITFNLSLLKENKILKDKLENYQGELNKIQTEFSSTFQDESQKLLVYEQQISDLKFRLREKEVSSIAGITKKYKKK